MWVFTKSFHIIQEVGHNLDLKVMMKGAGETLRLLRSGTVLVQDQGSVPAPTWSNPEPPVTPAPEDLEASEGSCTHMHIPTYRRTHVHIIKNRNKSKQKKRKKGDEDVPCWP